MVRSWIHGIPFLVRGLESIQDPECINLRSGVRLRNEIHSKGGYRLAWAIASRGNGKSIEILPKGKIHKMFGDKRKVALVRTNERGSSWATNSPQGIGERHRPLRAATGLRRDGGPMAQFAEPT
jgi:hypothetical protein